MQGLDFHAGPLTIETLKEMKRGQLVRVSVDDRGTELGVIKGIRNMLVREKASIMVQGFYQNPLFIRPELTNTEKQKASFIGGEVAFLREKYQPGTRIEIPREYQSRGLPTWGVVTGFGDSIQLHRVSDVLQFQVNLKDHGLRWWLSRG